MLGYSRSTQAQNRMRTYPEQNQPLQASWGYEFLKQNSYEGLVSTVKQFVCGRCMMSNGFSFSLFKVWLMKVVLWLGLEGKRSETPPQIQHRKNKGLCLISAQVRGILRNGRAFCVIQYMCVWFYMAHVTAEVLCARSSSSLVSPSARGASSLLIYANAGYIAERRDRTLWPIIHKETALSTSFPKRRMRHIVVILVRQMWESPLSDFLDKIWWILVYSRSV